MRLSFSPSFALMVLGEVWRIEGVPIAELASAPFATTTTELSEDTARLDPRICLEEYPDCNGHTQDDALRESGLQSPSFSTIDPFTQPRGSLSNLYTTLQKREGKMNSTLMTAIASILIVAVLIGIVVGGLYFLRKHLRSTVREIELKPSVSRAGERDPNSLDRSSTVNTATSDDFSKKEVMTPAINLKLQRTGPIPPPLSFATHKRDSRGDEESSIDMSKDHLQTLRYEAGSPSPSINSVSSTAPLVSGSQQASAAGHKRRISTQRRLSVQTTFRSLMVEHSSGSPVSNSTVLEAFEEHRAVRSPGLKSPSLNSPLRSPGLRKTPRNQD